MKQHKAILLLGSNSGNRFSALLNAQEKIEQLTGSVIAASSFYSTAAWGKTDQPDFINRALIISTPLPPSTLLQHLLKIELSLGRRRLEKWGPRIIDIDILFYDHIKYSTNSLTIPHPEIQNRRFALIPVNELLPNYKHPVSGITIKELLFNCADKLPVIKI